MACFARALRANELNDLDLTRIGGDVRILGSPLTISIRPVVYDLPFLIPASKMMKIARVSRRGERIRGSRRAYRLVCSSSSTAVDGYNRMGLVFPSGGPGAWDEACVGSPVVKGEACAPPLSTYPMRFLFFIGPIGIH